MKKIILLIMLFISSYAFSDTKQAQHVHQYIVREAYKLLKLQLGYDIPVMRYMVGNAQQGIAAFAPGGLLVIGAYREDEEDIVFNYSNDPWHSCTHFWDSDCGDTEKWYYYGILFENAY